MRPQSLGDREYVPLEPRCNHGVFPPGWIGVRGNRHAFDGRTGFGWGESMILPQLVHGVFPSDTTLGLLRYVT